MGQRHVLLALEARDPDGERPHEPPVQPQEHLRVQHDALAGRGKQRRPHLAERLRQLEQDLVDEERVGVVDDLLLSGEVLEPLDGVGVGAGHRQHRGVAGDLAAAQRYLQRRHPAEEPAGRLGEDPLDLGRQRPGALELLAGLGVLGHVRVVDQQHDRLVGVLLERGRQQRGHDDPLFLLVGGDDRGQRRALGVEVLVQAAAGGPVVGARPVEEPEPAQQVRHRGRGQQRDDQQVQDLFRPGYRALVAGVEEVGEEPVDGVGDPRGHGDDDGEPAHRDPAVADRLGHHRQRLGAPVAAQLLAALGRRLLLLLLLRGVDAVPARAVLGLPPGLPVPPVVAVHARRNRSGRRSPGRRSRPARRGRGRRRTAGPLSLTGALARTLSLILARLLLPLLPRAYRARWHQRVRPAAVHVHVGGPLIIAGAGIPARTAARRQRHH